eukprot:5882926-Pyramimonas_sp.AAC.1
MDIQTSHDCKGIHLQGYTFEGCISTSRWCFVLRHARYYSTRVCTRHSFFLLPGGIRSALLTGQIQIVERASRMHVREGAHARWIPYSEGRHHHTLTKTTAGAVVPKKFCSRWWEIYLTPAAVSFRVLQSVEKQERRSPRRAWGCDDCPQIEMLFRRTPRKSVSIRHLLVDNHNSLRLAVDSF